jgi:hydroxymethylpyrimidine pyrophosphatase-like HAD family hydrolase
VLPGRLRAVVSDLDGTIVPRGSGLSDATVAAVRALRAADVAFLPASGRTPAGLHVLAPVLPEVSAAVCCNGAIGLGPGGRELLWQERLDVDVVADLAGLLSRDLDEARERDAGGLSAAGLAAYDGTSWSLSPEYAAAFGYMHAGPRQVVPLRELGLRPASLLAVHHPGLGSAALTAVLARSGLFDRRATITYADDQIVNIAPAGVDKGTGVRRALEELGIDPADAVGFGDGHNDVAMAGAVGHFVAVDGAHAAVLEVSDEITGAAAEDGVAGWLARAGLDLAPGEAQPALPRS